VHYNFLNFGDSITVIVNKALMKYVYQKLSQL
jgi:hypothetical protein